MDDDSSNVIEPDKFRLTRLEQEIAELRAVVRMILRNLKVTVGKEVLRPDGINNYMFIGDPKGKLDGTES
jgi:hypothetical protein